MEVDEPQPSGNTFSDSLGKKKISEDGESYRMVVDEQREYLSYETLKQHLPSSIYEAVCLVPRDKIQDPCFIDEYSLRMAFQNAERQIPTANDMYSNLQGKERDDEHHDEKRKRGEE